MTQFKVYSPVNKKRPMLRHIIMLFQSTQDKKKILKSSKEKKQFTNKRLQIRAILYFSTITLEARTQWDKTLKHPRNKDLRLKILYPAKL